jgi:hypothetical protein
LFVTFPGVPELSVRADKIDVNLSDVNDPVEGVPAPIGVPLTEPPVITTAPAAYAESVNAGLAAITYSISPRVAPMVTVVAATYDPKVVDEFEIVACGPPFAPVGVRNVATAPRNAPIIIDCPAGIISTAEFPCCKNAMFYP